MEPLVFYALALAGICGGKGDDMACFATRHGDNAGQLAHHFAKGSTDTSLLQDALSPFVAIGLTLQSKTLPSLLVAAALMFALGVILFSLGRFRSKVNEKNHVAAAYWGPFCRRYATVFLWGSVGFALLSVVALSQGVAAFILALTVGNNAQLSASPGTTLQALEWLAFAFSTLFALGAQIMVRERGTSAIGQLPPKPAPMASSGLPRGPLPLPPPPPARK
ncbi:hypothetical protein BCR34DRAFT_657000 [Clohesyomyces aquaticus]|uniref:Uncharacterized protein n=1 Tax=Clohesyomyces aquaticus TaxID=1231657 RepID=A0A1Y1ZGD6_9PLEO|nr:hypothetical protein BCR34DRAFT_657000 [Clohesyomyces aquaticus]